MNSVGGFELSRLLYVVDVELTVVRASVTSPSPVTAEDTSTSDKGIGCDGTRGGDHRT